MLRLGVCILVYYFVLFMYAFPSETWERGKQQIINRFKEHIFPLSILSSGESEIFDVDVLELDKDC
jgi:hypothetical protein